MNLIPMKNKIRFTRYERKIAPVAQLDRVSASEAEGCGFDPRQAHHLNPLISYCQNIILANKINGFMSLTVLLPCAFLLFHALSGLSKRGLELEA